MPKWSRPSLIQLSIGKGLVVEIAQGWQLALGGAKRYFRIVSNQQRFIGN
jgi:hypothetical protein